MIKVFLGFIKKSIQYLKGMMFSFLNELQKNQIEKLFKKINWSVKIIEDYFVKKITFVIQNKNNFLRYSLIFLVISTVAFFAKSGGNLKEESEVSQSIKVKFSTELVSHQYQTLEMLIRTNLLIMDFGKLTLVGGNKWTKKVTM